STSPLRRRSTTSRAGAGASSKPDRCPGPTDHSGRLRNPENRDTALTARRPDAHPVPDAMADQGCRQRAGVGDPTAADVALFEADDRELVLAAVLIPHSDS